ncbi:MAG: choice-of-anchor J domain-containing protein [Psychroserpens sp.]|uniref:T9SS-dependent choice-of-anchor J family protein n=1 Tax=Psychroserpens sp. TaxID=2020870 RepID=UPI003003278C
MMKNYFILFFAFLSLVGVNAQTVHWSEDFSAGIPAGWNNSDEDLDGQTWLASAGSVSSFSADPNNGWAELFPDNWLVTDAIDLSAVTGNATLKWNVQCLANYGSEQYDVYVATANDLVSLAASPITFGENPQNTQTWSERTLDVSDFVGSSTVYVAFRHHDTNYNEELQIDNLSIESPPPADYTITHNLGSSLSQAQGFTCGPNDRVVRHFELSTFGVTGYIELESIDIGVWQVDIAQTITVNVYEADGTFPAGFDPGTATVLGTEDFALDPINVGNANFMAEMRSYDFTTPILVPSTVTHIVVEYVVPNPVGANFHPAQGAGTGEPGYFGTDGCGGLPITATGDVFPQNYEYFISVDANDVPTPSADYTITHNFGSSVSQAQGFTCGPNDRIARHFELATFGVITPIDLVSIDIGVFQNDIAQTITVNVYEADGTFPTGFDPGTATVLGTEDFALDPINVGNANFMAELRSYNFTTPILVPSTVTHIVVEYVVPNPVGANFLPAQGAGTGQPGYFGTDGCGGLPITATADSFGQNYEYFIALNANESTLSNSEFDLDKDLLVYPNPTTEVINIKLNSNNSINNVRLFDILGAAHNIDLINNQINVSSLSSGLYILQVETTNGMLVKRIIKK